MKFFESTLAVFFVLSSFCLVGCSDAQESPEDLYAYEAGTPESIDTNTFTGTYLYDGYRATFYISYKADNSVAVAPCGTLFSYQFDETGMTWEKTSNDLIVKLSNGKTIDGTICSIHKSDDTPGMYFGTNNYLDVSMKKIANGFINGNIYTSNLLVGKKYGRVDQFGDIDGYEFTSSKKLIMYTYNKGSDGDKWTSEYTYTIDPKGFLDIAESPLLSDSIMLAGNTLFIGKTPYYLVE